jgi:hypothetical protein
MTPGDKPMHMVVESPFAAAARKIMPDGDFHALHSMPRDLLNCNALLGRIRNPGLWTEHPFPKFEIWIRL